MGSIGTFVFYLFFFAGIYLLARNGEKKESQKMIIWAYVLFFLLTVLRYDVGNDYRGYYLGLDYICGNLFGHYNDWSDLWARYLLVSDNEPMFLILAYLFHWFPNAPLYVIGVYSAVSIYFFYRAFDEYKVHSTGLFLILVTGFLFWYWDLIRQSVPIAIFLYSMKYIRDGQPWKYVAVILLSMLFHYSAFFLLPFYFLQYLKLNRWIYVSVIVLAVIVLFANVNFDRLFDYIGNLPIYNRYEYDKRLGVHFEGFGYKLRLTSYSFAAIFAILRLPKNDNFMQATITIGAVLLIVSRGNLLVDRIAVYPYFVVLIGFAYALKHSKDLINIVCKALVVALLLLQAKSVSDASDRGCSPYKTVFSSDFANGQFKDRDY